MKKVNEKFIEIKRIVRSTNPMTPEAVKEAEELGMIAKKDLVGWSYYLGSCRNANVAMWEPNKEEFIYLRTKFGDTFAETIKHPEDDEGWDVFVPMEKMRSSVHED